ncbi:MAG TPA: hypothetical protein VNZ86_00740 [Bacteroidia bacterium]|nr:hypothetical protein [Bacteroidia bacterium]
MPATKGIQDEKILELLKEDLSPTEICRKLKISYGTSQKVRMERISRENGIDWKNLRKGYDKEPEEKRILHRIKAGRRIHELEIKDGIILVGTDPHYSRIDHVSVAHKAFCNVLSDLGSRVRAVVINGDVADFGCVSRFPRGPWRNPKHPSVKDELEAVQERLSEIEAAASKNVPLLRTLGNHDDRLEAKLSAISEALEGLHGTRLSDHIPRWIEAERIDVNGHLEFIHNHRSGEIGRDRQNVLSAGRSVCVGHSHQLHVWAQSWRRETCFGICAGTLADLDDEVFSYLGSRPANWQSGLAVLTWADGVLQYPEVAAVIEDRLYFRGKRYA